MVSKLLSQIPQLIYGFSERTDGSMLAQRVADQAHRQIFFQKHGIPFERTAAIIGAHSSRVQQVAVSEARPLVFPGVDGLFTLDPSRVLTLTGADCFPVYVVDPIRRVTGMCHAGWRGVVAGVLPELISQMVKKLHAEPTELRIFIGPGIRACHFEVKMDVWSEFPETDRVKRDGGTFIDLPKILREQALTSGISPEHLEDSEMCTVCRQEYFSYRRDKPKELEVQVAYLGWQF